jgi:hypothetical protein
MAIQPLFGLAELVAVTALSDVMIVRYGPVYDIVVVNQVMVFSENVTVIPAWLDCQKLARKGDDTLYACSEFCEYSAANVSRYFYKDDSFLPKNDAS